ncbi:MAG: D-tyrosyl-tRNA(Tyr) deacylase [Actinobacteria bacterium]|nr:D-tyrosyl-tRNA(Tyr) deacylase [Actinomycetota bacterium]
MRAVVQRVSEASVSVSGKVLVEIGQGLVVLLAVGRGDTEDDIDYIVDKVSNMRIFERDGKFDRSILDTGGEVLLVSQFTLYGDVRKGRRPSFTDAAPPDIARGLYEVALKRFNRVLPAKEGEFQARMSVTIVNDGPVTILLDSKRVF